VLDRILVDDLQPLLPHELDEVRLDLDGVRGDARFRQEPHELAPAGSEVDDSLLAAELVHIGLLTFGDGLLGPDHASNAR
jgi:hypothetical protein